MKKYFSLVKFSHTVFALPFAMIGFTLGILHTNISFQWQDFLGVLICMVSARTAAMAFNRWADRNIDINNPRTAIREIPAGIVSSKEALFLIIASCIIFILSSLWINTTCFYLSPIALLVVLGYSYTKRFTPLCHIVLGIGLALAPIGAYIAATNSISWVAIVLGLIVLFWVSGFDIIYALQDEEFDKQNKLYSIPSFLGKDKALLVSRTLHLVCAFCLFVFSLLVKQNYIYIIGAVIFTCALIYQHTLVKANDLSKVNLAFFTTNGIASILFGAFTIFDFLFIH